MFVQLDETLQLGLDCVAALSPRRAIAFGWTIVPRGVAAELSVTAGPDALCGILHAGFHTRTDIVPADPRRAVANGFTLLFDLPDGAGPPVIALSAGTALLRADTRDPKLERNLAKAMSERSWRASFGLLREAAHNPALGALLRLGGRSFGIFAEWAAGLPLVRGRGVGTGRIAEVEALATPSGEVLVMLRADGPLPPGAPISVAMVGWLRGEPGTPPEMVALPFAESHEATMPAALAFYGRIDSAVLDRLTGIEMIVLAEPEPGEAVWLRCQPAPATVPDLLDAASRGIADALAVPVEAAGAAGLDLLRHVIARREAAFTPLLAMLGASGAVGGTPPRTLLLLGVDDPAAARLFHVTAGAFARHCDTLLVIGAAADEAAQAFARGGPATVLVGAEAMAALRGATAAGGIIAVDAAAFAEAVIAGVPEDSFGQAIGPGELSRLLALHIVAGCAPALSDTVQRALRSRRATAWEARFPPVPKAWGNPHAAEPANAHLERLWSVAGTHHA